MSGITMTRSIKVIFHASRISGESIQGQPACSEIIISLILQII